MTREEMRDKAVSGLEKHLADAVAEDGIENLYDSVYTVAFDALHDAGVCDWQAGEIAAELAREYALP